MIDVPNMRCHECDGPLVSAGGSTFCRPCMKQRFSPEAIAKRQEQHEADAALGRAIREAIDRSPRMIDLAFTAEKLREVGLPQSAEVIDVIATELRKERGR